MFDFMAIDFQNGEQASISDGPYIPEPADCMRCGMCVSACPTFQLFQSEQETPRRRVRTLSKLLVENVPVEAEELAHLNNCLQCRACETVCPSHMAYGQLFDQAQARLQITPNRLGRLALGLIERKAWLNRLMPLLRLYLKSGLRRPLRQSGLLRKLQLERAEALLAEPALGRLNSRYPASGVLKGRVALFSGCLGEHFDRDTLSAAIKLLNAIGYEVWVPAGQGCCGAVHRHNGQAAEGLIARNIQVFNALPVETVLHAATGCGAMLADYPNLAKSQADHGGLRHPVADINDFLLQHWPADLALRPLKLSVAVHEPCSQRNVLKNQPAVYALLAKIPQLQTASLADNHLCCGAGGSYMLTHPDNADRLRSMKRQAIKQAAADVTVSCNFACGLFLAEDGGKPRHPLSLLARLLP